jgi:DNA-binding CsgD family transcriptional regulator
MAINLKNHQNMTFFLVIAVLISADIIFDFKDGISFRHLLFEFGVLFICLVGFNLYFDRMRFLARQIQDKESKAIEERQKTKVEIETLKSELSTFKNQFKTELDQQFKKWKFTPAESEVAVYLLKGLSLKEIADARQCNDKTIRAQCTSIYKKSNLKGRSQLSSYFLDFIV